MNIISKAEYARHRGVSRAAVSIAIREGRITLIDGKIDPVAADAQWNANTRNPKVPPLASSPANPVADTSIPQSLYDLQLARAKREYHEANLAEMRERQRAGELVELRDVQLAYTTLAAQFRSALERIPDKLATRLAAETSADAIHALLSAELDQCLVDMARMAEQIPDRLTEAGANG